MKKILLIINLALTSILSFVILFHPDTSFDQDLGRHIKIGEIIVKTGHIPTTNLFTYTNPNFPFSNHHWLSEVIFYLLNNSFGPISISILKILVLFTTLTIAMYLASKISSINASLIGFLLFIPLIANRTDERPEIFGLLLFSLLLLIYLHLMNKDRRWLYFVPFIQMLWVNLHITFIYGYLLIGIISLFSIYKNKNLAKFIFTIFGFSIIAGLINPQFINGLIYPLRVFENYGYSIVENQNLFYLSTLTSNIFINYFWVISLVCWVFIIYALYKKRDIRDLSYILIYSVFFLVSIQMLRNFPFFAIVGIICMSYFVNKVFLQKQLSSTQTALIITTILLFFNYQIMSEEFYKTFDINKEFKLTINKAYRESTKFFISNKLKGPIFNNFDIGGYLDFALYPETKTFVDNRPEAFPIGFFDEYKAQYDLDNIKFIFNKYKINTVFYSHTDGTQWASEFLKQMKNLPEYKLVYFDAAAVIYEKNSKLKPITDADFENVVNKTSDSHQLIGIYRYLLLVEKNKIANQALEKAYKVNPQSCQIRLQYGLLLLSSTNLYIENTGKNILKDTWICPFPNEIKSQIANL